MNRCQFRIVKINGHIFKLDFFEDESVQLFFGNSYSKLMLGVKLFFLSFLSFFLVVSLILAYLNSSSPLLFQELLGVIAKAHHLGLHVPGDLSVIGCDDTPMSAYMKPNLTTIRYPFDAVGRFATGHLIRLILGQVPHAEAPAQLVLPVELIVRESTSIPRSV